jgi:hypothetical protein
MIRLTKLIEVGAGVKVEGVSSSNEFIEFASKRYDGAKKIADNAEKKGGPALLTYEHFVVKLPYYEAAKEGKFVPLEASKELKEIIREVGLITGGAIHMEQNEFQRLIGRLEVLGELLIKCNEI